MRAPRRICPHNQKGCKVCKSEYYATYRKTNGETLKAKNRESRRKYYRENTAAQIVYAANKRAEKVGAPGVITLEFWLRIKTRCYYCGAKEFQLQIEHLIPLSKGGTNEESNIVAACEYCNRAKNNRSVREFKYWLQKARSATPQIRIKFGRCPDTIHGPQYAK